MVATFVLLAEGRLFVLFAGRFGERLRVQVVRREAAQGHVEVLRGGLQPGVDLLEAGGADAVKQQAGEARHYRQQDAGVPPLQAAAHGPTHR
jgi:hypothetical protein